MHSTLIRNLYYGENTLLMHVGLEPDWSDRGSGTTTSLIDIEHAQQKQKLR